MTLTMVVINVISKLNRLPQETNTKLTSDSCPFHE